jgi:hypothetical protein
MNTNVLATAVKKNFGRTILRAKKVSPELMVGVGIIGFFGAIFLASRASTKLEVVLAETNEAVDKLNEGYADVEPEKYDERDYQKDLAIVTAQKYIKVAGLYFPAALLAVASTGLILGSNRILNKRNAAVMAAYKLLSDGFANYRRNVAEEFGNEKDKDLKLGIKRVTETETVTGEDGTKSKVKRVFATKQADPALGQVESEYARYFDNRNCHFKKDHSMNLFFLKSTERYANDLLNTQGHLFLNEVYDMLGFPRTTPGAVVGWVKNDSAEGDQFVDFGISPCYNVTGQEKHDFVNGWSDQGIMLDFNVDGLIYDLI